MPDKPQNHSVVVGLNAVIIAWDDPVPRFLVRNKHKNINELPFDVFQPLSYRTLEENVRALVDDQAKLELGYIEQLYTFGNRGRDPQEEKGGPRFISIGYLALLLGKAIEESNAFSETNLWKDIYAFFPWEDWREGQPVILSQINEALENWAAKATNDHDKQAKRARIHKLFGKTTKDWNEELVLERYELLYEADLIVESLRDKNQELPFSTGIPMEYDHRRILATGIGRLRSKIKYRPVVFELMPSSFTLLQLQHLVEALSGKKLHKQNFRRLLERTGMLEPTGEVSEQTGGRPAQLYRFRAEIMAERQDPNITLPSLSNS
ncbi:NUDIX hydrolase [Curvivirga sp.]|uniref:NUDIX hydrolase n=1 Tax=Curvivirga sp. TaxID=2856848 RepID=UPI003B5B9705